MNGILESKNDKNEEKRIRVVEIFRVLHLIIYIYLIIYAILHAD